MLACIYCMYEKIYVPVCINASVVSVTSTKELQHTYLYTKTLHTYLTFKNICQCSFFDKVWEKAKMSPSCEFWVIFISDKNKIYKIQCRNHFKKVQIVINSLKFIEKCYLKSAISQYKCKSCCKCKCNVYNYYSLCKSNMYNLNW